MARGRPGEFVERFKRVPSAQTVNASGRLIHFASGRPTHFRQRERIIAPHHMAMGLLASCAKGQVQTLADLHRDFNALFGNRYDNRNVDSDFPSFP